MALETTVFTFNNFCSVCRLGAKGFDSAEVVAMHEANAIKPLYRGVCKDDPESVVVIHQAEEGIAKAFFEAK